MYKSLFYAVLGGANRTSDSDQLVLPPTRRWKMIHPAWCRSIGGYTIIFPASLIDLNRLNALLFFSRVPNTVKLGKKKNQGPPRSRVGPRFQGCVVFFSSASVTLFRFFFSDNGNSNSSRQKIKEHWLRNYDRRLDILSVIYYANEAAAQRSTAVILPSSSSVFFSFSSSSFLSS